jgi:hypothetical protein
MADVLLSRLLSWKEEADIRQNLALFANIVTTREVSDMKAMMIATQAEVLADIPPVSSLKTISPLCLAQTMRQ